MAEIDSLEIQITASSRAAASAIDALNRKLGTLASSLNFDAPGLEKLDRISGDNIKNLGVGLNALGKGLQSIQSIRRIDFGKIATDVRRLSNIQSGNLQTLGNAMRPLADGINALSKAKVDNANLTNLINSLTRLSNANLANLNGANFTQLGTSIKDFANAVSGANKVEQSTIAMTNAVAKLAAAGKNIGKVTGALPHLANNLKAFMNTMHEAPQVANETITFAQAIGTLASAGDKTKSTASNLKQLGTELKNFMQTMSTAPNVSDSVIRMTTALSGLVNQGGRVTLSSNSLSSSFSRVSGMSGRLRTNLRNLTGSMSGLSGATSKTASSFKGFLRQLMSATGVYFSIYGAIRGLKSAIDISSDLTEVQNVVDVAFGNMAYKVEEFAKVSVKDFGMSELTTKEIAGRFQAMSTAIGVSADKIGQANTFLSGQTKGYVAVSDSMADVSINLTKLAADMASFYNVEQTDVAKSLESIFTGTTAPLRKYGLDLTQATLAEWAMKQGLDADIRSMSQAEKTMLRYQYVLANTKAAQGDFARTADSWANQTRVLAQQFEILASVIGGVFINAFKPVVKTLNAVMEKVISFAKTVADALGTIFGWTFEVNPGGMTNDFGDMSSGIEDVADSAGDAADKVKDTTDEVKDLKANLQGFDKLNVISLDKDKDKGKDKGTGKDKDKGAGLGGTGGLDTNLFEVDSVMKKYKSSIDTLYKLGEYIGDTLTDALNSINWDKVYAAADNFGIGLALFLNGLISPELFAAVGQTIAGALNTALHALDNFGATFDWKNLGDSLSAGLVAFLKGIDWESALSAAANWGTGIATTLNSFISPENFGLIGESVSKAINVALKFLDNFGTTFKWTNFGKSLGTGLNKFLKGLNWKLYLKDAKTYGKGIANAINAFLNETDFKVVGESVAQFLNGAIVFAVSSGKTIQFKTIGKKIADGLNGFFKKLKVKELAEAINVWVKGALTTVSTLLQKTDFEMIGRKIGTFLAELDFLEVMGKLAGVLLDAIKGAFDMLSGMLSEAPIETILIAAFAAMKFLGVGKTIASAVSKSLATNLAGTLGVSLTSQNATISSVVSTALQNAFNGPIQTVVGNLGKIAGAVAGAAAAFGEFSVVSDAVENLASGTGNFVAEIGKIAGAVGLAEIALTAAFGPAGAVVGAIVGVAAAVKGINDAFKEIETEKFAQSVHDTLVNPGGVTIEELVNNATASIEQIGNSFSAVREKSSELSAAKQNVEAVVTEIDKIKTSIEAGVISSEEGCERLNTAYSELAEAISLKIGAAGDVLLSTFSENGIASKAFESAGVNIEEMKKKVVSSMDETQKEVYSLTEELKNLRETNPNSERIPELEQNLRNLATGSTESEKALQKLETKLGMKLDWKGYINAEEAGIDSGKIDNDLNTIIESVTETRTSLENDSQKILEAAKELGDPEVYESVKSSLPGALDTMYQDVNKKAIEVVDIMQTNLIDEIPKRIDQAKEDWANMNPVEKFFSGGNEAHYIKRALEDYKKNYVDPMSQAIESHYSELGIDGAGWASEATKEAINALFDGKVIGGADGLSGAFGQTLKSDYKGIIDDAVGEAKTTAETGSKDVGKALVDGLASADTSDARKFGEKIGDETEGGMRDRVETHSPSKVFKSIGKDIIDGLVLGLENNWKKVNDWWKTSAKLPEIKAKVEDIKKKVADEWKRVTNYWKKKELEITSKFKTTKENVNAWWENVKKWWGEKNLAIKNEFKTTSENVSSWWNALVKMWGDKKLSVKNEFKTTSEKVASWWSKILKWWGKRNLDVRNAFKTTKENVVSWWTKVKNWWGSRIVTVKTEYKTTKETVQSWGKKTVSWLKAGINGAWADFSSWFTEKMKKLMNGAINGMNWVLKGVGSETRVPVWKGYARGADGLPRNTVGMVNDQKGSTYRELIVPPNGNPFVPEGRNVLLPMKKGTKILPADKTKQLLEIIPHFAKGIGDFSGSIFDYLDKPKEILKIGLDKHMDLSGLETPILDIANGMKKLFADNGENFIKKEFEKAITVNYKVGAGVKQWSGLAAKALQITGQYSAANLSYLLQQMHHESRGNPNAINLWDSNAKKGTPSKGLMQVIDPTFRANAKPPYNKNIYDPLSNMIAAINYTVKRYGSLYKGWAARGFKGYAEGIGKITLSDVIPGYATGGFPTSGQLFMARENGIPEMVGKIGNRTAVANNEQITDAVAKSLSVKLGDTTKQLEDIMNALAKSIQKSFEDAENKSGVDQKAINEAAGKVSKELSSTLSSVEKQFSETGEVSRNEMQSLLSKTKEIIEQTKAQSSENAAALSSIYQDISTMASSAFDKLEQTAKSYNDYAKKAVKETEYKADIEVEIDSGIDDEAYEAGQNAVSSFSEGMQNYISDMEGWVNDMRDAAANGFSGVADQMQIYGYDAMNGYDYGIGSGYDDLADTVYNAASSVSDGFSGIEADVVIDGGNVITGLQEGMSSQWETLTEWLNERKEELSTSLYEIGDYMKPIGERIVTELLAGIESMWGSVEEWSAKLKDAFSAAQEIAASLEQEQSKVSAAGSKSKVSEAANALKANKKQYKEADFVKVSELNKYQQTATSKQYNKYSTQAGNDIKNQNARDMSVSMITAMNQVLVPALQKIGNTTVELKGDAKGLFDAVVKENSKFKTITGASAMR